MNGGTECTCELKALTNSEVAVMQVFFHSNGNSLLSWFIVCSKTETIKSYYLVFKLDPLCSMCFHKV